MTTRQLALVHSMMEVRAAEKAIGNTRDWLALAGTEPMSKEEKGKVFQMSLELAKIEVALSEIRETFVFLGRETGE